MIMELIFNINELSAQKFEVGVRYMPTFSKFDVQSSSGGVVKGEVTLGYGIGGLLAFNMTNYSGIQGEIIYNSISQKYKEVDTEHHLKLRYVNIPLLYSLNTGKSNLINLNVVAGPQIGVSVGSEVTVSTGGTTNAGSILSVKKGDLGFAYGAGLDFALKTSTNLRLTLGYRGVIGLVDISDRRNNLSNDDYYLLDKTNINTKSGYIGLSFLF